MPERTKKECIELIHEQAQKLNRLELENRELKDSHDKFISDSVEAKAKLLTRTFECRKLVVLITAINSLTGIEIE